MILQIYVRFMKSQYIIAILYSFFNITWYALVV